MSGRRNRAEKNWLDVPLFTNYTLNQVLLLPQIRNYKEIYPNLYIVDGNFITGFVNIEQFSDVNHVDRTISCRNLEWVDKPSLALSSVPFTVSYNFHQNFYLFAKWHRSDDYIYLGFVEKITTTFFPLDTWYFPEDYQPSPHTILDIRAELTDDALITLRGSRWILNAYSHNPQNFDTTQLVNEITKWLSDEHNKTASVTFTRYDGLHVSIGRYGDRCSIDINTSDGYLGHVIDYSIPDNRARVIKNETDDIAFELRRTIDTNKAMEVIKHIIMTGERPAYIEWQE